jgi:NAD-dependent SIR2 family protein deacetylase
LKRDHTVFRHKREIMEKSETAGCFYCRRIFSPSEITEYTRRGQVAVCPYCGVDSVIGSAGAPVTRAELDRLHELRFGWHTVVVIRGGRVAAVRREHEKTKAGG